MILMMQTAADREAIVPGLVLCSKRRAYAFFGERRRVDRVMHEPRAVIVPEVMIRVCRIKPNGY